MEDECFSFMRPLTNQHDEEHPDINSDDQSPSTSVCRFARQLFTSTFWQHHSFWMGSLLGVIAASMNIVQVWKTDGDDNDDDDGDGDVPTKDPFEYWDTYKGLMVAATFLYLLDAVLHIRSKYPSSNPETGDGDGSTLSSTSLTHLEEDTSLWFASLFGVAAAFDLCCSFLQDADYPWPAYVFECLSVYLFGMAANFLLYTKRDTYWKQKCSLVGSGDVLFWIGCSIDVVVSVLDNPTSSANSWWIAIGGMISSVFWFVDAMLYEVAGADIFDMEVLLVGSQQIAIPQDEEIIMDDPIETAMSLQ